MIIWKGRDLEVYCREDTSDWNTVQAAVGEDEYGLAEIDMTGLLVFDVGAHIGSVGLWCAARGARVVCVEPVPDNADLIERSAELNGLALSVERAVAGLEGTAHIRYGFHQDATAEHHAFIGSTDPSVHDCLEVEVPSITLAWLCDLYGVPDIMKIDCEGGEWAWIDEPAIQDVPLVVGEWHPVAGHELADFDYRMNPYFYVEYTGPVAGPGGFRAGSRRE
jgi:FkbM family methyltransferase